MRIYEELFILKPDVTEEEIDALTGQLEGVIKAGAGSIDKIDKWGVRRLAYRVAKKAEGYYVLIQFRCDAQTVKEVERRLRVTDSVMKYLTVRIDEKLKWLEKRKKAREKRAARRPAPPAAAPAIPIGEPGPPPGTPAGAAGPGGAVPSGPTPGAPAPGAPVPATPVAENE